jgi:hypothetical protein
MKKTAFSRILTTLGICLVLFLLVGAQKKNEPQPRSNVPENLLDGLEWRCIGPAIMGGRIDDFAVVESDPDIIYTAAASGGLWKTVNSGITWEPIFDGQSTSSIGAVTIAPSSPDIVWVGTGESNNRQSSSWGDGVYKSEDAGLTWKNMGLRGSHHIGRIVVHPQNPEVVYVAALGRLLSLARSIGSYTGAPSEGQLRDIGKYGERLNALIEKINAVIGEDIPRLNKLMDENDIPYIAPLQKIKVF